MLVDTIQAEFVRLQLHSVNLNVSSTDDRLVALRGSLLPYWNLPPCLDGQWLLAQLQELPNAAGPEAVMNGLVAAHARECTTANESKVGSQLRLFDSQGKSPATRPAAFQNDS